MSCLRNLFSCVGKKTPGITRKLTKVKFDAEINESFKTNNVPSQLKDLLVYIAREGVAVTDLFRRPGNPKDMKEIIKLLKEGSRINWTDYNFYTLANAAKRFLLSINQGVFGPESEAQMLACLDLPDDQARYESMHNVIVLLPQPVQQLLALLFGIWFRMIYHTEVNAMSVEAVAKSVAGSVFPSCTTSPEKVERASKVMEYLITGFASADLFGQELIEYFTRETKTSISRIEKFKYEFRYPKDVPREKSVRLFVRMLLEEGKKHGFDLIRHAVTKEAFEAATSNPMAQPGKISESRSPSAQQQQQGPTSTPPVTANMQLSNVQQTSEKRTLVSNAAVVHRAASVVGRGGVNGTGTTPAAGGDTWGGALQQDQEEDEEDDEEEVTDISAEEEIHALADSFFHNPHHQMTDSTTSTGRAGGPTIRFNSVKRRQMERLQKRSDWFLSPPAGCRSDTLMQLSPADGVGFSSDLATSGPDILQSTSAFREEEGLEDDDGDLDSERDSVFGGSGPAGGGENSTLQPSSEPSIRRLAQVGDNTGRQEQAIVIGTGEGEGATTTADWRRSARVDQGEEEELPEVETRYFVVQRYYGPGPQPPLSPQFRLNQTPGPSHTSPS